MIHGSGVYALGKRQFNHILKMYEFNIFFSVKSKILRDEVIHFFITIFSISFEF